METMDEVVISEYINISQTVKKLKKRLKFCHWTFYQQTMTTHLEYTDLGIKSCGFRPDQEIVYLYERMELIENQIERNTFRKNNFEKFLKEQLSVADVRKLKIKYIYSTGREDIVIDDALSEKLLEGISEIETAICFREGIEPDPEKLEFTEDLIMNIDILAEVFAI